MEYGINQLLGKTISEIKKTDEEILFICGNETFKMCHSQSCCENVMLEDVDGDLSDLIGSPLTQAEESTNSDDPMGRSGMDSFTWTFYKLATVKGYVTLRWLGESNGYYSESVDVIKI